MVRAKITGHVEQFGGNATSEDLKKHGGVFAELLTADGETKLLGGLGRERSWLIRIGVWFQTRRFQVSGCMSDLRSPCHSVMSSDAQSMSPCHVTCCIIIMSDAQKCHVGRCTVSFRMHSLDRNSFYHDTESDPHYP